MFFQVQIESLPDELGVAPKSAPGSKSGKGRMLVIAEIDRGSHADAF